MKAVDITVKELRSDLLDDYLSLFDEVYRNDPWLNTQSNPWWGICYCGFYDDPRTEQERNTVPNAAQKGRDMRAETIRAGTAHGLLAYVNGRIMGWCNVGPRSGYGNLHNLVPSGEDSEKIGSILCFVVATPFRGNGICTRLLHAACDSCAMMDLGLQRATHAHSSQTRTTPMIHQPRV